MGEPQAPQPVKLIAGFIFNDQLFLEESERILSKKFGEIDYRGPNFNFSFTNYYEDEIGKNPKRRFVSFKVLIPPDDLSRIKLFTNRIERQFKRKINIDPGYITGANLVLATTKNYSHRIYLERGIYAEVTLIFINGTFKGLDWTYPDYKARETINCFNEIRLNYLKDLRAAL